MYYRERDGQLLKTKIIATMGEPRGEIYSPDDEFIKEKVEYPRLFSWFVEERAGTFMVDVLRLNMAFYKHGENERKIFRWLVENKNGLAKNVAVLGDLPGPKIRLGNVGEKPVKLSKGDPFNLYLAISGFPNHKISYDIRPVWNLHNFWPVQIHSEICTLSFNAINCACNQQKNQPVLRRA